MGVLETMQGRCFLLLISSSWCLLVNVQAGTRDSERAVPIPPACLDGSSMVDTQQRGPIQLRDLKLNDLVLTYTPGVGPHFTEFLGWLTRSSSSPTLMLKISTSTNSSFASFPHRLCQQVSAFLRIFTVLDDEASQHEDGERQAVTVSIKILEMFGLRGWIPPAASEMNKEVKRSLGVKVADEKILHVSNHIEL